MGHKLQFVFLCTVKLVIDLETQKVKEPLSKDTNNVVALTDDIAWVEAASEATESVVLDVSDSDERTGRHGDYIRYPRDLLLFLQHHPISRRFPAGIAESEIVHRNLNRKAFHAKMPNARCVKMPNSAVKSFNQICGPTNLDTNRMLDMNLSHIRQGENIPRSQILGALLLIQEYKALFPMIEEHLVDSEKKAYKMAISDMEVICRSRTKQFRSDNVSSGFVSRVLNRVVRKSFTLTKKKEATYFWPLLIPGNKVAIELWLIKDLLLWSPANFFVIFGHLGKFCNPPSEKFTSVGLISYKQKTGCKSIYI